MKKTKYHLLYPFKPKNRFHTLINNYVYKHILFLRLLQKHYEHSPFDIYGELKKQNYFYHFNDIKAFHGETPFYTKHIKNTLTWYYNYICGATKKLELDKIYFVAFTSLVENVPVKKVISEWCYKSLVDLESEYLTTFNLEDIKNLLKFKLSSFPTPKSIPIFENNEIDIQFDEYIIEISTKNSISYVPTVRKLKNLMTNSHKGIIINPRFEMFEFIELEEKK